MLPRLRHCTQIITSTALILRLLSRAPLILVVRALRSALRLLPRIACTLITVSPHGIILIRWLRARFVIMRVSYPVRMTFRNVRAIRVPLIGVNPYNY